MRHHPTCLLSPLLLLLALAATPQRAGSSEEIPLRSLPPHDAADATAPAVTEANLLANDRFWPYQMALSQPWKPEGRSKPLPAGTRGVLIRVEPSGARIDFGRDGLEEAVPIGVTNIVELANQVRLGELEKIGANFVVAVGPRLFDSESPQPRTLSLTRVAQQPGFLCVFADPGAEDFDALAAALAPLRDRHGVVTILFPQGEHPARVVRDQLRELHWPVPVVLDRLAEPYTHSLLSERTPPPAIQLVTREGRLVFESRFEPGVESELAVALDRSFGSAKLAGSSSAP